MKLHVYTWKDALDCVGLWAPFVCISWFFFTSEEGCVFIYIQYILMDQVWSIKCEDLLFVAEGTAPASFISIQLVVTFIWFVQVLNRGMKMNFEYIFFNIYLVMPYVWACILLLCGFFYFIFFGGGDIRHYLCNIILGGWV